MTGSAEWYLTRGSGVAVLLLITASMVLGLATTLRWSGGAPRFVTAGLHRNLSLMSVVFLAVHVLTTVADGYTSIGLVDAVVPFAAAYRPLWLGLGALALDLLVALIITSLVRVRMGLRLWRGTHWAAYAMWPLAMFHALGTGSDAAGRWMMAVAVVCAAAVGWALAWRLARADGTGPGVRLGLGLTSVLVPVVAVAWFINGPMQPGWAARSGTPPPASTAAAAVPGLPAAGVVVPVTGTVAESSPDAAGQITVRLVATAAGRTPLVVRVLLHGPALTGGGVAMRTSRATYGTPLDPTRYTGTVTGLTGQRIGLDLTAPGRRPRHVTLDISLTTLDIGAGTLTGDLVATPVVG